MSEKSVLFDTGIVVRTRGALVALVAAQRAGLPLAGSRERWRWISSEIRRRECAAPRRRSQRRCSSHLNRGCDMNQQVVVLCLDAYAARAQEATTKGAQAFRRLLRLAEHEDSGQSRRVAQFIAATYNGRAFPFDLYELRPVDVEISDAMLICIDALRWGRADLHTLVPDGDDRVRAVIRNWGLRWPKSE